MSGTHWKALSAAAVAGALLAPSVTVAQSTEVYRVNLDELNNSDVRGKATLQLRGDQLTVIINARGLEPGGVHVGHIHGLLENGEAVDSTCPTPAQDLDEDGYVELPEGIPTYGGILIPLGIVDPDADGRVNYRMTFDLNDPAVFQGGVTRADLTPLAFREIVLHGMTVPDGEGEGENTVIAGIAGEVDGGENGYLTVLPVACGAIKKQSGPKTIEM